jgi:hypothetical protein
MTGSIKDKSEYDKEEKLRQNMTRRVSRKLTMIFYGKLMIGDDNSLYTAIIFQHTENRSKQAVQDEEGCSRYIGLVQDLAVALVQAGRAYFLSRKIIRGVIRC